MDCSKIDWTDSIICQSVPDMRNQAGSVQWMYIRDDKVGGEDETAGTVQQRAF